MIRYLLVPPACLAGLAACAAQSAPPATASEFRAAALALQPAARVEIVEVPKPLPLPGPLVPMPVSEALADQRPPLARVEAANSAAMREPASPAYLNAIQVYPYAPGALYRLYTAPERVTDIALQPGESVTAVAAGDTTRWTVGDTTSGSGATKQVHVLVKPFSPDLSTNLIITTDRRAYHLQLVSTAASAMAAISWTYPEDELLAIKHAAADADTAAPVARGLAIEQLRFGYRIEGDSPAWRPLRAFDDGRQTFIEFPASIAVGEAPPLFVLGEKGDASLVNYRMSGRFYIVDRLFDAAELRLGAKEQAVVRIVRDAERRDERRRRAS